MNWITRVLTFFVACAALMFVAWQPADGAWSANSATSSDTTQPLAAGQVTGTVGVLNALSHTGSGTSHTTTGDVGVHWNGSQYQHSDDFKAASVSVYHSFTRDSEGGGALSFSQNSTISVSGSASRLDPNDPSWWWNSQDDVSEFVGAEALDSLGQVIPTTITWATNSPARGFGEDAGNQAPHPGQKSSNNDNSTTPPSSTYQIAAGPPTSTLNGVSSGSIQLPDVPGATAVAFVSFTCRAIGCVDNATVTNNKLNLNFTFTSNV